MQQSEGRSFLATKGGKALFIFGYYVFLVCLGWLFFLLWGEWIGELIRANLTALGLVLEGSSEPSTVFTALLALWKMALQAGAAIQGVALLLVAPFLILIVTS